MQTPARPFTIGGSTMAQRSTPQSGNVRRQEQPRQQQQQMTPSTSSPSLVRPGVFPSPPASRVAPSPQQYRQQQFSQPYEAPSSASSSLPRSNSTPALPGPSSGQQAPFSSSSSSQQLSSYRPPSAPAPAHGSTPGRQGQLQQQQPQEQQQVGTSSSSSSSSSSSAASRPTPKRVRPINNAVTSVSVNPKLAIEARKAVMAKRMRINLLLLLGWWLVTDTRAYA